MKTKNNGFTLIELLVSIGILAVLTGLAVFNFNQARVRARDVQRKNDLGQLQKALESYKNDANEYPSSNYQTALSTPVAYIKNTFTDPRASEWINYQYLPLLSNKAFYLMACLENTADTSKTTVASGLCSSFGSADCKCGSVSNKTGVMYIITNP